MTDREFCTRVLDLLEYSLSEQDGEAVRGAAPDWLRQVPGTVEVEAEHSLSRESFSRIDLRTAIRALRAASQEGKVCELPTANRRLDSVPIQTAKGA